ncbi:MAG: adenylate/guanylate cyclase domain-containing protein, partial [Candidatus Riflebacteria bacterium]|nr:adenylate/guanylate cyclase domain-containing protein [Candidatus Riflebacteria bacterium]
LSMHAHDLVAPGSNVDFFFFRNDGVARAFRARNFMDLEIAKLEKLCSVKYLENLGCLDGRSPAIKKLLQMTSVADGIMETMRQDYFDYRVLKYEANETYDINRFDDFSRMIWFLIPESVAKNSPVRAMATTNVANLNYVIYSPWEFAPDIFSSFSGRNRHNFLMGQRRHDDMVLRWYPEYVSPHHRLNELLNKATAERFSTGDLTGKNGHYRYEKQRFSEKDTMVFSGISTSSPDYLMALLAWLFPFLQLAFALTSLLLFADALQALFITPVKGIAAGADAVAQGDYSPRLLLEKTDEFSLLADSFNEMTNGLAQREKMRRFVSENLYERLEKTTGLNEMGSAKLSRLSMLASDIRGFTTLSEQHDPQQIVSLLNDYFTVMETAIKKHGGVIERFVGDAVSAVFYAGGNKPSEVCAAEAALEMRRQLAALNRERLGRGLFTVENGIGIATGEAISGIAGREGGRMVFAVFGEVVQRAELLESLTRKTTTKILVCAETRTLLAGFYRFDAVIEAGDSLAAELCGPCSPEAGKSHG